MVRKLLFIIFFSFCFNLIAQAQANNWIEYSQSYYKFKVAENRIYRIDYQTLLNAGIPLSSIDPRNFQLFARGKEVPIFIQGESDGVFNVVDYIEFYGRANDGWLDTALYKSKDRQPNPHYSLFTDSISYFLTWNNSQNNLRFREENATNFSSFFKASFVWKEVLNVYTENYYDGEILNGGLTDPEYVPSEGWMDRPLTLSRSRTKTMATPNLFASGPGVDIDLKVAGASNWNQVSNGDHHLQISIGNQLIDTIFEAYQLIHLQRKLSTSVLNNGNSSIKFSSIDDRNADVDRTALAYIKLTYPRSLSFSNKSYDEFLVDDAINQSAQFLELSFFNGGDQPVLYDLTNRKKVLLVKSINNVYRTIIPNGNGRKKCVISSEAEIKKVTQLKPVGSGGKFTDYATEVEDTTYLMLTVEKLLPEVTTYAAYRRSTGYRPLIALMHELYDQYAFGIEKHPMAIRNFIDDALGNWSYPVTDLFLVGKSVSAKDYRKVPENYAKNLVPTLGNPATDNLLTSGLNGGLLEPAIPMGRLSAKNMNQVKIYLDKVIEYEAAEPALWMKRALHFAGGKSTFETNTHENFLNGFAKDFSSPPYGGEAQLFRKSTSAPFQLTLADSIRQLVNEGVAMLTFFGHSSATGGFDISIDTPDKLQNQGRYHLLLANSCFAGNTHQPDALSTSEQYVLEPRRGAVAFIASGNLGFSFFLNIYSSTFYENFAGKNYGKSLAENMQLTVREIQGNNPSLAIKSVSLEMTLQGDPALVLNAQPLPDYKITPDLFEVQPKELTTDLDSFTVSYTIQNIGRAVNDSIRIRLSRTFPNGNAQDTTIIKEFPPVHNTQKLSFTFPIEVLNGVGQNKFTFVLDPFNEIEELSEFNNRIESEVVIRSGEIIPVYPYKQAIVGEQGVGLKASTAFPFETEKRYVFELDTNLSFNSPFKKSKIQLSEGGVVEWEPEVLKNMPDSAVYFWRVSKLPEGGSNDFNWRNSSFQYLPGESGWAQAHFDQFKSNNNLFLKQNDALREFEFTERLSELLVRNIGSPKSDELTGIFYALDADTRERGSCFASPAFLIAVLDSLTFDSWKTPFKGENAGNDFGQANVGAWCFPNRNRSESIFNFQVKDSAQLFAMRDFINNKIPDGAYVVAYNWLNIDYDAIRALDPSILKAFENLGSTEIGSLKNNHPFIITVQKGKPQTMMEVSGDSARDVIEIRRVLTSNADFGQTETSNNINLGSDFSRLAYQFKSLESPTADSIELTLSGIQNGSSDQILRLNDFELDSTLNTVSNLDQYSRLVLNYNTYDPVLRTPPQLKRWQLNYRELPDLALAPNLNFKINKDSLQRGEELLMDIGIHNVSNQEVDSVEISYKVINNDNRIIDVARENMKSIPADSTLISQIVVPTENLVGSNTLLIEINPDQSVLEQHSFNNFGQYNFFVFDDNLNPLLDVTFDGRQIMNREIVSSSPQIDISLRDDNSFLLMDDTSTFSVFLKAPNEEEKLLNYGINSTYRMEFKPANGSQNKAMVRLKPDLKKDGVYELLVQAKDKSGNASGKKDYRVQFEVINKSTVSRLLNYPNPFSTSTRFVFTLTGNQVPDQIQIQIMTVTGKVVREIDQFELGPIHIGNNITEYAWDGKDDYGDQLANGVYLYRVKMRINGNSIDHRETNADQFFTREFGKMFLLR